MDRCQQKIENHHQISVFVQMIVGFERALDTGKVSDANAGNCRLRHISNTPQGKAIKGNAADYRLMVEAGDYQIDLSSVI
jgi:hypothetical protein